MILAIVAALPALAAFTDGNELQRWMLQDEAPNGTKFESGLYKGYITGVVDLSNGVLFCTTPGVTRAQNVAIVTKYIKANPEKWNLPANVLVVDAMAEVFPCPKKQASLQ